LFEDTSDERVASWHGDFGDGTGSTEQNPMHLYGRAGKFTVVLDIEGPGGKSRRTKVWEVALK
jgi:PKD repeat protein